MCFNDGDTRMVVNSSHIEEDPIPTDAFELGVGENKVCYPYFVSMDLLEVMHTKCLTLAFDVKYGTDLAMVVFLSMPGAYEVVQTFVEPMNIFSPRLIVDLKQDANMPISFVEMPQW
uniref:Uncharacterized protein n=1 Tax=Oryza punctata TaxID=4537 RepID=A0A0E0M6L0_ORYPU